MDFFLPVPGAVDIKGGEIETITSTYVSLTDNLKLGNFSFGYGANYSQNQWRYRYIADDTLSTPSFSTSKSSESVGLTFNSYYRIGKTFHIGLVYRPTFFRIKPTSEFIYEHLISIDFAWKWKIKK